uniref:Neur_chan_LBD domain-containing protein n=1 Tax=Macrostomum lignano TaxID=282301 RepID=A0A1I8GKJ9_9PLAT
MKEAGATVITSYINIRSMGPISELHMDYALDLYFRQRWQDPRLRYDMFNISNNMSAGLILSMRMLRQHLEAGYVFPMDEQICPLIFGSYGYPSSDILYRWKQVTTGIERSPVVISTNVTLSQFNLTTSPEVRRHFRITRRGNFSVLSVYFHLVRHTGFFIIQSAGAWAELSANKTSLFVNWQPVTEDRPALLQPGAFIACSGCLYMFSWDQALPRCQRALLGNLCLLKDQPDPTSLRREAALLAQQVDRLSSAAERRNHLAVRVAEAFDILEAALASRQCRNPIQNLPALPVPVAKGLLCASVSLPGLRIGSALAVPNAMRGCAAVTVVPDCRRQQPEGPASCIRLSAAPHLRYAASTFVENPDSFQTDSDVDFIDKLKNNANLVTMATERQLALLASVGQQLADMLSKLNEPVAMETGCNLCQQLFDPLCDLAKALLDGRSLLTDAAVLTVPNNDSSESAC